MIYCCFYVLSFFGIWTIIARDAIGEKVSIVRPNDLCAIKTRRSGGTNEINICLAGELQR